jgi:hypothetical protein
MLESEHRKVSYHKHMPRTAFHFPCLIPLLIFLSLSAPAYAIESALELRDIYTQTVDRKLNLPEDEQRYYSELLLYQLQQAQFNNLPAQYMLMVDRSPQIQAVLLFWLADDGHAELIGASPVSTGKEGGYEFFETPLGIFDHNTGNPDFRAEGTINRFGLKGYGEEGMRVYDFGWVTARKTWVAEMGKMRLQLHSTDLLRLEPRLGLIQSKGCIRIPASLNKLLDHYGVLDADYERAITEKKVLRILDPGREPTPWSGRYMIIVDTRRVTRPDWAPLPVKPQQAAARRKPGDKIKH